jgi:hypothetical protein
LIMMKVCSVLAIFGRFAGQLTSQEEQADTSGSIRVAAATRNDKAAIVAKMLSTGSAQETRSRAGLSADDRPPDYKGSFGACGHDRGLEQICLAVLLEKENARLLSRCLG